MDPDLYNAAIHGSSDFSERLTEDGSNIYLGQVTSQHNTILHVAAKSGQRKFAEQVLCSNSSLLHETNAQGNTALHIASRLGHLEMIRLLANKAKELELEADISLLRMANLRGNTALHEAVRNGHYEVSTFLIDEDRDLACLVNNVGESPLFLAVDRGFYRAALHMIESSPRCYFGGRNGMNALHAAVIRAHKCNQFRSSAEKQAFTIWNKLSYINQVLCPSFKFPLLKYEIAITGSDFVGKVLMKCPPCMVEADDFGWVPLHYAAHLGNVEAVELFIKINHSSVLYIKDKQGMSALHIAAKGGRIEVMKAIIAKCPDTCELLDDRDRTVLHVAVESKKKNAVNLLLRTLPFQDLINEQDQQGDTPLHVAASNGHSSILEMLAKDTRVDKGAVNKAGMTAIDIIRSKNVISDFQILKTLSMATLQIKGALPSLEQKVIRDTAEEEKVCVKEYEHFQETMCERRKKNKGKPVDKASCFAANSFQKDETETNSVRTTPLDVKNMSGLNLLVSAVIATVSFTAAFMMPGGYNTQGFAISSRRNNFKMFLLFDSLAFGCSVASMFVHFLVAAWPKHLNFKYPIYCITGLTEFSLVGLVLAFLHGALVAFPDDSGLDNLATNSVLFSFSIPLVYFGVKIGYSVFYLFKGLCPSSKNYC